VCKSVLVLGSGLLLLCEVPNIFVPVGLRGALLRCRVEAPASVAVATSGYDSRSSRFGFGGVHADSSRARPGNVTS
jgi:hypothetical protein